MPDKSIFSANFLQAATVLTFSVGLSIVSYSARAQDEGDNAFDGEWRYSISCASCHGDAGEGIYAFGPPLKDDNFVLNSPPEIIMRVIQEGRYNRDKAYPDYPGMPSFHYIRAGEARALIQYLKTALQE